MENSNTAGSKLSKLKTSVQNLANKKASVDLNNLSQEGKNKIVSLSTGLSQDTISNTCLSARDVEIPLSIGRSFKGCTVSGTFRGVVPAGKDSSGRSKNYKTEEITFNEERVNVIDNINSRYTGKITLFITTNDNKIIAGRYLASHTIKSSLEPNTIWYDLSSNQIKQISGFDSVSETLTVQELDENGDLVYDNGEPVMTSEITTKAVPVVTKNIVGFKIGEITISNGTVVDYKFDTDTRILDALTSISNTEDSKVPVGTIISYSGKDVPKGYLVLDGGEYSKLLYADLYSVIGDTQLKTDRETPLPDGYFQVADMTDGRYLRGIPATGLSNGDTLSESVSGDDLSSVVVVYDDVKKYRDKTDSRTDKSSRLGTMEVYKWYHKNKTYKDTYYNKNVNLLYPLTLPITRGVNKVRPKKVKVKCKSLSNAYGFKLMAFPYSADGGHQEKYYYSNVCNIDTLDTSVELEVTFSGCGFEHYWGFSVEPDWVIPENSGITSKCTVTITSITWEIEGTKTCLLGQNYAAGLPNIYGSWATGSSSSATGHVRIDGTTKGEKGGGGGTDNRAVLDAGLTSKIYGKEDTVVPESLGCVYLIKY